MAEAHFTREEILNQLDDCAREFTFPMLDNGYVYLADTRLSAFGDDSRWALIIEIIGANYRAGGYNGIDNTLYCFGNSLLCSVGTDGDNFLRFISDGDEAPIFDDEISWYVNKDAKTVRINETIVPINLSLDFLLSKGIVFEEPPKITAAELLRSLVPEYSDLMFASEEELNKRVPQDLPCILCLREWHHPDLATGELPSESPIFQMIADVLITGEPSCYRPVLEPNTDWRNWLEGGTL